MFRQSAKNKNIYIYVRLKSMLSDESKELYNELRGYGYNHNESWDMAVNVHGLKGRSVTGKIEEFEEKMKKKK